AIVRELLRGMVRGGGNRPPASREPVRRAEPRVDPRSAGLAVRLVPLAVGAVLLQLKPVRVVAPVLPRDVVAVLALLAGQRDLRPNVGGSHVGVPFSVWELRTQTRPGPRSRGGPAWIVAEAGLEPATQRL